MRIITVYESTDGSRWDVAADAGRRDVIDASVRALEAMLPSTPRSSDQRIAVDEATVEMVKQQTIKLCRSAFPTESVFQSEPVHVHGYAGRFLSDCGGPLNRIWWWFSCYHAPWLYEQPYFAMNPDKWRNQ